MSEVASTVLTGCVANNKKSTTTKKKWRTALGIHDILIPYHDRV